MNPWVIGIITLVLAAGLVGFWLWFYPTYYDYGQKNPKTSATGKGSKALYYGLLIGAPILILGIGGIIIYFNLRKKGYGIG